MLAYLCDLGLRKALNRLRCPLVSYRAALQWTAISHQIWVGDCLPTAPDRWICLTQARFSVGTLIWTLSELRLTIWFRMISKPYHSIRTCILPPWYSLPTSLRLSLFSLILRYTSYSSDTSPNAPSSVLLLTLPCPLPIPSWYSLSDVPSFLPILYCRIGFDKDRNFSVSFKFINKIKVTAIERWWFHKWEDNSYESYERNFYSEFCWWWEFLVPIFPALDHRYQTWFYGITCQITLENIVPCCSATKPLYIYLRVVSSCH